MQVIVFRCFVKCIKNPLQFNFSKFFPGSILLHLSSVNELDSSEFIWLEII